MTSARARARWLDIWIRAVIVPASRRAAAVWIGCAIVGGLLFGRPHGIAPDAFTHLALSNAVVGGVIGLTWLLVFAPTARMLVRADAAAYLRSLPGPTRAATLLTASALLALQLPWLLVWVAGEGLLGLAIIGALTLVMVALARWRPRAPRGASLVDAGFAVRGRPERTGWPGWRREGAALRAIHLRALRRRAGDALIRGAGLAILAGATAGLFIRNNELAGPAAGTIGAAVIAIVLVPAVVGVLLVILVTHRSTEWLAASLGTSRAARIGAVVYAIAVIELGATAIAVAAAALVADAELPTIAWLAKLSGVTALASALGCARVLLAGEDSDNIAARTVVGAVVVAALGVVCLGLFDELGGVAFLATTLLALLQVKA